MDARVKELEQRNKAQQEAYAMKKMAKKMRQESLVNVTVLQKLMRGFESKWTK